MTVSYSSFTPPTGNVVPAVAGIKFTAPFTTKATFTAGIGETCAPGEYRQYVKGTFKVNGMVLDHVLCGSVKLSTSVYLEDGCPSGSCTAYGHRSCPQDQYDQYLPQRPDGCQFSMYDAPGFTNISTPGNYSLDLSFQGKLINTASGGAVLVSGIWTTTGSTIVKDVLASASVAQFGLAGTDKIIGAHSERNAETGESELHIVITRPPDQPQFNASKMKLSLIDAAGVNAALSAPPAVYEVGGLGRSTVSIVYKLPSERTPERVALSVNGGQVTMKVEKR
jgi:hypothetical protein